MPRPPRPRPRSRLRPTTQPGLVSAPRRPAQDYQRDIVPALDQRVDQLLRVAPDAAGDVGRDEDSHVSSDRGRSGRTRYADSGCSTRDVRAGRMIDPFSRTQSINRRTPSSFDTRGSQASSRFSLPMSLT